MNRLETAIPEEGSVRSMIVTEKQYNDMKILLGDPTPQENSLQDSLFTLL
jgi:CRISPR-associated protein Cas2